MSGRKFNKYKNVIVDIIFFVLSYRIFILFWHLSFPYFTKLFPIKLELNQTSEKLYLLLLLNIVLIIGTYLVFIKVKSSLKHYTRLLLIFSLSVSFWFEFYSLIRYSFYSFNKSLICYIHYEEINLTIYLLLFSLVACMGIIIAKRIDLKKNEFILLIFTIITYSISHNLYLFFAN
jgi:hypothetical protein